MWVDPCTRGCVFECVYVHECVWVYVCILCVHNNKCEPGNSQVSTPIHPYKYYLFLQAAAQLAAVNGTEEDNKHAPVVGHNVHTHTEVYSPNPHTQQHHHHHHHHHHSPIPPQHHQRSNNGTPPAYGGPSQMLGLTGRHKSPSIEVMHASLFTGVQLGVACFTCFLPRLRLPSREPLQGCISMMQPFTVICVPLMSSSHIYHACTQVHAH